MILSTERTSWNKSREVLLSLLERLSISPKRKVWRNWSFSPWKREGFRVLEPSSTYKRDGERLLTLAGSDRIRWNGSKLKESRFRSNARKKFFPVGMVKSRLSREAVDANSWQCSRSGWTEL